MTYDCTLYQPKVDSTSVVNGGNWNISGETACTASLPFGTAPSARSTSTLPFQMSTSGTSYVVIPPGSIDIGTGINVNFYLEGTVMSAFTVTLTNLTAESAYVDGQIGGTIYKSDAKELQFANSYYVTDPSVQAIIVVSLTATTVTYAGATITTYSRHLGRKIAMLSIDKKLKELRKLMDQAKRLDPETPGTNDQTLSLVPTDERGDRKSERSPHWQRMPLFDSKTFRDELLNKGACVDTQPEGKRGLSETTHKVEEDDKWEVKSMSSEEQESWMHSIKDQRSILDAWTAQQAEQAEKIEKLQEMIARALKPVAMPPLLPLTQATPNKQGASGAATSSGGTA